MLAFGKNLFAIIKQKISLAEFKDRKTSTYTLVNLLNQIDKRKSNRIFISRLFQGRWCLSHVFYNDEREILSALSSTNMCVCKLVCKTAYCAVFAPSGLPVRHYFMALCTTAYLDKQKRALNKDNCFDFLSHTLRKLTRL